jgi:hypothetical protein
VVDIRHVGERDFIVERRGVERYMVCSERFWADIKQGFMCQLHRRKFCQLRGQHKVIQESKVSDQMKTFVRILHELRELVHCLSR